MSHLAELNIARLKHPIDHPAIADFVAALDAINGVAERSPGFVWRFVDEDGVVAGATPPFNDPMLIVNMSVWETPEALETFTWNTVHKRVYERKAEWFNAMTSHHLVMWWVDEGVHPTLDEAAVRLAQLDAHGSTNDAFTWDHLPRVKLWQTQRCG